jgi:outer membrane protein insertion porin family
MIGAGFSSVDKIIGFAEVSQSNFDLFNWPYFHGGGQKLRASMEIGSESRNVEVSLTEPWFLDRRLSLSGEVYRRELSYDQYDVTRLGGGPGLTVPLRYGRVNFRYAIEKVTLDDLQAGDFVYHDDPTRAYRFTDENDDYLNAPFRVTWMYDTRNRAFVPTRGTRGSIFAEVNGPLTGGDNEIVKVGTDFRHWFPLWAGHVLSLHARAESVESYGDTETVPIGDRLFLGGGRTVRGFRYRDIGTKVLPAEGAEGRYHPVGGLTMAMASAEYTIPVFKVLRLAAFYDVGGVWSESFDADLDRLASSAGLGIRFDFPGFPIRIDYAVPVEYDDDYTRSERFVLWIGFE